MTWNQVTVPANGSKRVTLKVKANAEGKIPNSANATWPGDNGGSSGNTTVEAVQGREREFVLIYHEKLGTDKDNTEVTGMPDPLEQVKKSTEMTETLYVSATVPKRQGYTFVPSISLLAKIKKVCYNKWGRKFRKFDS